MRRLWRVLRWLLLLLVMLGAAAWVRLWIALPDVGGTLVVEGPVAPIEILRDPDGVPHVRAASEADAFFGLGLVHAQDRLWQIEVQRRLASGRLAEFLGERALKTDRFFRTLGLRRAAEDAARTLPPDTRRLVDAYVAGVNAIIAGRGAHRLPIEFTIFGITPEPFTAADALVWPKVLALVLSTNYRDEVLRARIAARVGVDGAAALLPAYSDEWPLILPEFLPSPGQSAPPLRTQARPATPALHDTVAALATTLGGSPYVGSALAASNNWVVGGARSATGKPLLANDPHLAARLPSTWYLAHVEGGRLNAIGASLPGTPGIAIGHNARIAWGLTNVMADVQDLYVERLNGRGEVEYNGAWEPLRIVRETIRVRGGADVPLAILSTRHGPIVTDVIEHAPAEALALRWVALEPDDTTIIAFLGVLTAGNWDEFTAALAPYRAPVQNWVYADVDGNIGYIAPGALPIRTAGDGTVAVPGWVSTHEWAGFVPPAEWPRAFNPPGGLLVTANNKICAGASGACASSTNWEPGYRAQRILERLSATAPLGLDDIADVQADVRSAQVDVIRPWLSAGVSPEDAGERAAIDAVRNWDGRFTRESVGAAIYMQWQARAARALFEDELGEQLWADYGALPHWVGKALHGLATSGETSWCDDRRTEPTESCPALFARALSLAVEDLRVRHGRDMAGWRWGAANVVTFGHLPLEAVPVVRRLFSRRAEHVGHDFSVTPTMRVEGQTVISSYRQIVDLADLDRSRYVHPLGQSGQWLSAHYDDLHDAWRNGRYLPMRFSRAVVDAAAVSRLRIEPQSR